jgi:hypothetical protein
MAAIVPASCYPFTVELMFALCGIRSVSALEIEAKRKNGWLA